MHRRTFNKIISLLPLAGVSMNLGELGNLMAEQPSTATMPAMFVGHGNPMNAIEENEFTRGWRDAAAKIPTPAVIICISAHWETKGTLVTAMEKPKTIHDFGGFPRKLYEVQYPAPGSPEFAQTIKLTIKNHEIGLSQDWGLDHGCWSPIIKMYPDANIPIVQLSLDYGLDGSGHFELSKQLAAFRNNGALLIGSGNMVHNLGLVAWDKMNEPDFGFDWALEASAKMKKYISEKDFQSLINYRKQGRAFDLAINSAEHYLPMLYVLALMGKNEKSTFFNDKAQAGSLTMTSFVVI